MILHVFGCKLSFLTTPIPIFYLFIASSHLLFTSLLHHTTLNVFCVCAAQFIPDTICGIVIFGTLDSHHHLWMKLRSITPYTTLHHHIWGIKPPAPIHFETLHDLRQFVLRHYTMSANSIWGITPCAPVHHPHCTFSIFMTSARHALLFVTIARSPLSQVAKNSNGCHAQVNQMQFTINMEFAEVNPLWRCAQKYVAPSSRLFEFWTYRTHKSPHLFTCNVSHTFFLLSHTMARHVYVAFHTTSTNDVTVTEFAHTSVLWTFHCKF